jgi:hypothetical protein
VRALPLVVAILLALAGSSAPAPAAVKCPREPALGAVEFVRAGALHRVSLGDCSDRVVGRTPAERRIVLRSPSGRLARVVVSPTATRGVRTFAITVDGRPLRAARDPIELLDWSPDSRWLLFAIDPMGSASLAADGLELQALRVSNGRAIRVATALIYEDYRAWCGNRLVLVAGGDRIATTNKRLVVAGAPAWRPRQLWADPGRAFGSVACAQHGRSVAVLSQPASDDASFFHARWQLWQVGLDGSRRLLDRPPAGYADESPTWLGAGALAFVRERQGHASLWVRRGGRVFGPLAPLGYSLGYYGHHDWGLAWRR